MQTRFTEFLNTYATPYDLTHMRIPDVNDMSNYLKHAKNSAPGLDGIPYAGWRAAGQPGAVTLHNVSTHMFCGFAMPFDFYSSLGIFPGKGEVQGDGRVQPLWRERPLGARVPEEGRPLGG